MKTKEFNDVQKLLQKVYDENFSFLKFDKFLPHAQQMMVSISRCSIDTYVAFDFNEVMRIIKLKRSLKSIMKARLIDGLLSARNLIDENIKCIEGDENET